MAIKKPSLVGGIASNIVGQIGESAVSAGKGAVSSVTSAANPLNLLRVGGGVLGASIAGSIETAFDSVSDAIRETKQARKDADQARKDADQAKADADRATQDELESLREQLKEQTDQDRQLFGKGSNGILSEILSSIDFGNELLFEMINIQNESKETQREQVFSGLENERESKRRKIQKPKPGGDDEDEEESGGLFSSIIGGATGGLLATLGGFFAAISLPVILVMLGVVAVIVAAIIAIGPKNIIKWIQDLPSLGESIGDVVTAVLNWGRDFGRGLKFLAEDYKILSSRFQRGLDRIMGNDPIDLKVSASFADQLAVQFDNLNDIKIQKEKDIEALNKLEGKFSDERFKDELRKIEIVAKRREQILRKEDPDADTNEEFRKAMTAESAKLQKQLRDRKINFDAGIITKEQRKEQESKLISSSAKRMQKIQATRDSKIINPRPDIGPGPMSSEEKEQFKADLKQIQQNRQGRSSAPSGKRGAPAPQTGFSGQTVKESNSRISAGSGEGILRGELAASGIKDPTEVAAFLGQMSHESMGFTRLVEMGNNAGARYEGRRDLGNTQPGDGRKYKGRGFIQLTGRDNYRTFGNMIGVDLESNPDMAADPAIAAKIAVAFWKQRVKPNVSDFNNTTGITKLINGGFNGLSDRKRRVAMFMKEGNSSTRIAGLPKTAGASIPESATAFLPSSGGADITSTLSSLASGGGGLDSALEVASGEGRSTPDFKSIATAAVNKKLELFKNITKNEGLKSQKGIVSANTGRGAGGNVVASNTRNVNANKTTINKQGLRHQEGTIQRLTNSQHVG